MRQRIAPRPVDEGWPTLGIVRTERRTVWPEQIADQIERAVGSVLGRAIAHRLGDAEAAERRAIVRATEEGRNVHLRMNVGTPEHPLVDALHIVRRPNRYPNS